MTLLYSFTYSTFHYSPPYPFVDPAPQSTGDLLSTFLLEPDCDSVIPPSVSSTLNDDLMTIFDMDTVNTPSRDQVPTVPSAVGMDVEGGPGDHQEQRLLRSSPEPTTISNNRVSSSRGSWTDTDGVEVFDSITCASTNSPTGSQVAHEDIEKDEERNYVNPFDDEDEFPTIEELCSKPSATGVFGGDRNHKALPKKEDNDIGAKLDRIPEAPKPKTESGSSQETAIEIDCDNRLQDTVIKRENEELSTELNEMGYLSDISQTASQLGSSRETAIEIFDDDDDDDGDQRGDETEHNGNAEDHDDGVEHDDSVEHNDSTDNMELDDCAEPQEDITEYHDSKDHEEDTGSHNIETPENTNETSSASNESAPNRKKDVRTPLPTESRTRDSTSISPKTPKRKVSSGSPKSESKRRRLSVKHINIRASGLDGKKGSLSWNNRTGCWKNSDGEAFEPTTILQHLNDVTFKVRYDGSSHEFRLSSYGRFWIGAPYENYFVKIEDKDIQGLAEGEMVSGVLIRDNIN